MALMADRISLDELRQRHILLFTREAAAVLHGIASRLRDAEEEGRALAPPRLDQVLVTDAGELVIDTVAGLDIGREHTMAALASLIEALLPPSLRDQPDYGVPGSFRVLAPRARGWPPGLPPLRTPGELAAAIQRYLSGDTREVLQHLYARTAVAPLQATATPPGGSDAIVPVALTPSVPAVSQALSPQPRLPLIDDGDDPAFDLPLRTRDAAAWVPPAPRAAARHDARVWLLAGGAILIAFTAGYAVTRHVAVPAEPAARKSETAPAGATEMSVGPAMPTRAPVDRTTVTRAPDTAPAGVRVIPPPRPAATTQTSGAPGTAAAHAIDDGSLPPPAPLEIPASTGPVFSPSFAASGSSLVFHAGRDPVARLMTASLDDGSAPLELVTVVGGSARNYHPRLSPDGRLLAFDSDRDGVRGVYVAHRDGSHVQRVSGPGFAAVPSWSPDMRSLAFVRAEPDRPQVWNLWSLDRATGERRRLTRHAYGQTWGASWFPDSRRVCYSHEDRIVVLDAESSETRTFASPLRGRLVRTPAVSPDGRLVAFQVVRNGVWLLDLETAAMRRLIDDPSAEEFAWAPEGGRLAYHSRRSGEWRIWIAAAPPRVSP